jgi:hypothetical protein
MVQPVTWWLYGNIRISFRIQPIYPPNTSKLKFKNLFSVWCENYTKNVWVTLLGHNAENVNVETNGTLGLVCVLGDRGILFDSRLGLVSFFRASGQVLGLTQHTVP